MMNGGMMNGGMDSMMGWMMGLGLLGWVLVVALLVTILVLLVRWVSGARSKDEGQSSGQDRPANRAR
jgi:uncharacterized membrane protein